MVAGSLAGTLPADLVEVRADNDLDPGIRVSRWRGARPPGGCRGQDADGETAALLDTDERRGNGSHHPAAAAGQQVIPGAGDPLAEAPGAVRMGFAPRTHDADDGHPQQSLHRRQL